MATRGLSALFDPASVAIVGASGDPSKWGNAVSRQTLRSARRPVYLINHRGGDVYGQATLRSLADIPGSVDLAVICVPAVSFENSVADALAQGAKVILAITAGLGETDSAGLETQDRVVASVRSAGALLVGPNCLGIVDNTTELYLASDPFVPGSVALLSQSGNLALELQQLLVRRGLGFSRFVSIGNQADVTLTDFIADCAAHEATHAIAIYAEDFRDGRGFIAATAVAVASGKPVVVLAPGSTAAAARSAASHTGSLASDGDVVAAACRAAGAHLVHTPRELADVLAMLTRSQRRPGNRMAILTDGGGHGTISADIAEAHGLNVPELSTSLQADLAHDLWERAGTSNPVDVAGFGEQDPMCFARGTQRLLASGEIDALLITGYFGGYSTEDAFAQGLAELEIAATTRMAEIIRGQNLPAVVHSMFPNSRSIQALRDGGVAVFDAVEDAILALSRATLEPPQPTLPLPKTATPIVAHDYLAARAVLAAAGLPTVRAANAATAAEVIAAGEKLHFPLVLKANGLLHKSDRGGVALGIANSQQLIDVHARMHAELNVSSYSVEEQADLSQGIELIVGVRNDARFGPVLLVGLGGIYAEIICDTALALAPVSTHQAKDLLLSLRGAGLLTGARGRPSLDVDTAAEAIAKFTELASAHPEIAEFEINPLFVGLTGVVALDARIVLGPTNE